jgi:PadR family transcriptional regulator PadR
MAKTDSLQGTLDLLVLTLLARRPRLHGYSIMAAIAEMSEDVLRAEEGSLYPALHRMEEAGWIRAEWVLADGDISGQPNSQDGVICLSGPGSRMYFAANA